MPRYIGSQSLDHIRAQVEEDKDAAAGSATASANSATASAASATSSANSASTSTTQATNSSNSATASANSATASGNSATASAASATSSSNSLTSFRSEYLGDHATDSAADSHASSNSLTITVGTIYFNTTQGNFRVCSATGTPNTYQTLNLSGGRYLQTADGSNALDGGANISGGAKSNSDFTVGTVGGTARNLRVTGTTTLDGNLTVSGTTTTVNTETINLADNNIVLNSNHTGSPTENAGITIERGSATDKTFIWNESLDKWTLGSDTIVAGTFEGALSGNASTVTNGVYTTGNQTIAGTKTFSATISGSIDGNSATVTNGVYTTGNQTIGGTKTFSSAISGDLTGNVTGNLTGNVTGNVTGDLTGDVTGDTTGNVTASSVLADGVTATTQSGSDNTTKVATTAFVQTVVTAQDLDVAGDSGTGAVDLDSQSLTVAGTSNEVETSVSGQTVTIGLPSTISVNVTGNVTGNSTGNITGDVLSPNGTTVLNNGTGAGTDSTFTGTSTNSDHVKVTDNESTNENNVITFVENAETSTGNHGLEMDGDFTYNPSTGQVNATTFNGALTGNVTGNVTGNTTGTVTASSSLADGVTATTQSSSDNSTKVATTAYTRTYVSSNFDSVGTGLAMAIALG